MHVLSNLGSGGASDYIAGAMSTTATFSSRGTSRAKSDDVLAADVVRLLGLDGDLRDDLGLSDEQVVDLYRAMVRTRVVDRAATSLVRDGRIGLHVGSLGEEATVVGSAFALRDADWVFPTERDFGAGLLRGLSLQSYVDNLFGNGRDRCKGRQQPDHWCSKEARLASISSPCGTQITHAVGLAWAAQMRGDDVATLVYFSDAATSSAPFHNAMNFAGVYKTPCVLLCRNSGTEVGGAAATVRQTASETFAAKGIAYGVTAVRCDGNDVFAVVKVTRDAVARAARGDGATLIEAVTERVSEEGAVANAAFDPVARLRLHLGKRVGWDDAEQERLERPILAEIDEVIRSAEGVSPPPLASMFADVFAEQPWYLVEQREHAERGR